ncbi:MAG TPA: TasA family protein [Patescibacteria group bacterium]|nr:TasA family protein [Patescibacteria group bacterium]
MKKILVSLTVILIAGGLASGATYAAFSDLEESLNNSFSTGTVDLEINGENPWSSAVPVVFSNLKPGDGNPTWLDLGQFNIKNVGSLPVRMFTLMASDIHNFENGCVEAESEVDTTCANTGDGEGELGSFLQIRLGMTANCAALGTFQTLGFLNSITAPVDFSSHLSGAMLDPGETEAVHLCARLSNGVGNQIMSDSATTSFSFFGGQ